MGTSVAGAKAFVVSTLAGLGILMAGTVVIAKYTPLLTLFNAPSGYVVGNQVDLPMEMYGHSHGTLVVFERSDCSACKGSLPYLKRLLADLQPYRPTSRAIAVTLEDGSADFGLGVDMTYRLPARQMIMLDLDVVPTLLWVDPKGKILLSHAGLLTKANSTALIRDVVAQAQQAQSRR